MSANVQLLILYNFRGLEFIWYYSLFTIAQSVHHGWGPLGKNLYSVQLESWKMHHLNQSTMVGANFIFRLTRKLQNASQSVHHGWRKFDILFN